LGDQTGAEMPTYDDNNWSNINLPHNFSIPYFQSAQWYTGYGWYRKVLDIPSLWKTKRIFVEFETAFRNAEIFVNGKQVGLHRRGYTGFSIDITKQLKTGKEYSGS
jgi:beta-galactosidase